MSAEGRVPAHEWWCGAVNHPDGELLCHPPTPGRTLSPGATSVEGMTDTCGASDFMIAFRTGDVLACTLPTGHPVWTVNPATGYSYNHHDAERDVWWNDGGPPPGVPREDWLNGTNAPARLSSSDADSA